MSVSGDPDAIESLDKLRELAVSIDDNALLGYAEYYIANWYYDRPDTERYQEHLKRAVYHLLRCNEGELLAGEDELALTGLIESSAGRMLAEIENYETGLKLMLSAVEKLEKFTDIEEGLK